MDDSNLMNIVLHIAKKYDIKLNNLKKQPLCRNETELNIWNEANIQYFKEKVASIKFHFILLHLNQR